MPIVHGLEETYGKRMTFKVLDWQADGSPELIRKYDLGRHGMVITDGKGKKIWSEPGHHQTRAGIVKAIEAALGS